MTELFPITLEQGAQRMHVRNLRWLCELAKLIGDIATGQVKDESAKSKPRSKRRRKKSIKPRKR